MHAIIIPRKWTKQPQYPVKIDWMLADIFGVTHAITPNQGIISKPKQEILVPLSNGIRIGTKEDLALGANGGTSDGWQTPSYFTEISGASALSQFILITASSTTGAVLGRWSTSASYGGMLTTFDGNSLATVIAGTAVTSTWVAKKTSSLYPGSIRYGNTWYGYSNQACYINGKDDTASNLFSNSPATIQSQNTTPLYLCRHGDASSGSGNARIPLALLGVGKGWSSDVHREINYNPWQIFKRDPQRIYFDVSTGLPTITSIAASNLTSSGARLTVN